MSRWHNLSCSLLVADQMINRGDKESWWFGGVLSDVTNCWMSMTCYFEYIQLAKNVNLEITCVLTVTKPFNRAHVSQCPSLLLYSFTIDIFEGV